MSDSQPARSKLFSHEEEAVGSAPGAPIAAVLRPVFLAVPEKPARNHGGSPDDAETR
ncbi:hypothetical protein [Nocardia sp. alder85J]|uniref:hypothetical protein n=1 Tax=Nocardia sp. alder85J TaxID=2862949 RepID=UPI001CD1DF0D|nr:hypothetical protein [Nocardia sp. alder85J]MCX4093225.1 hypothetical protein [Nocardia sp. alder85J]